MAEKGKKRNNAYNKAQDELRERKEQEALASAQEVARKAEQDKRLKEAKEKLSPEPPMDAADIVWIRFIIQGRPSIVRRFKVDDRLHQINTYLASIGVDEGYQINFGPNEEAVPISDFKRTFEDVQLIGKFVVHVVRNAVKQTGQ